MKPEDREYATDVEIEISHEVGEMSGDYSTIHITGIYPINGDALKRIWKIREDMELEED